MVLVNEHQTEAIGCATVAGFILLRGTFLVLSWKLTFIVDVPLLLAVLV